MAERPFDKASRYLAALDPPAFLGWLFRQPTGAFEFRRWIDTRGIAFPGEPNRVGNTVAHVVNPGEHGVPWAFAIEFQIQPSGTCSAACSATCPASG